jgi:hypothetical protein
MGEDEVRHPEERDQPVGCGQVLAQLPLIGYMVRIGRTGGGGIGISVALLMIEQFGSPSPRSKPAIARATAAARSARLAGWRHAR